MQQDIVQKLEQRLGQVHARQRLGIEQDHEMCIRDRSSGFVAAVSGLWTIPAPASARGLVQTKGCGGDPSWSSGSWRRNHEGSPPAIGPVES